MLYQNFLRIKPFLILSVLLSAAVFTYTYLAQENVAQASDSDAAVMQEFAAWAEAYSHASQTSALSRGRELLQKRSEVISRMIERDPRRIIENVLDSDVIAKLPPDLAQHLERQVSFHGDYEVYVADFIDHSTGEMTGSRTDRFVVIGGERLPAVVYGRREGMTTKNNIPMSGVRVGDTVVLDEAPAKKIASADHTGQKVSADVGGNRREFASEYEFQSFIAEQVEWEAKIGPDRGDSNRPDSSWTEGAKKALVIMVDFADMPGVPKANNGVPYTEASLRQVFSQGVTPFYEDTSYGKTSLTLETVTPVLRLPQPVSFYSSTPANQPQMLADARAAARAAGIEPNDYNLDMVLFSWTPLYQWGGLASLGADAAYINGAFNFYVVAHEFGHNYGLPHANRWQSNDGSIMGPGANDEYGDNYDTMGGGGVVQSVKSHFNTAYKRRLDWLTASDVRVATENGTYRIFATDVTTATGVRALKIPRTATSDYWVEFRQMFPTSPSSMNGATIRWEVMTASNGVRATQILDATPQTQNNILDHALQVGQTLTDDQAKIKITIVGKGGTTPESLDVKVELNVGCTFGSVTSSSTNFTATGGEGTLTAPTQPGCRVLPVSNVDWMVPVPSSGAPAGYIVAPNYGSASRTGTLTFNGQAVAIQQVGSATQCAPRPAGIVAWWRGDGDMADQMGGLSPMLLAGNYAAGKVGAGISNSITTAAGPPAMKTIESPIAALNQSLSIEGWIKVNTLGFLQRVIVTEQPSYDVQISSTGVLYFGTWRTNPAGGFTGASVGSDPLPTGQFVHFAGTLDDATGALKLYINGQLVNEVTTTERPMAHAAVVLHLARMNGVADEISIYNRALAASEIAAIHAAGTATSGAAGKCLTAAAPPVSVSGRVFTPSGQALRNAVVILTDSGGNRRTATTSSFGVYTFSDVTVATNYTLSVSSRRYRFTPRTIDISESLTNIDLLGLE